VARRELILFYLPLVDILAKTNSRTLELVARLAQEGVIG